MPAFDNLFNKVKAVTKDAADKTNKAAKIAKLKMNIMTLQTEKSRHLNTIGVRAYALFGEQRNLDGFYDRVKDELSQIERTEHRVKEIEAEITELQSHTVDVNDVTEDTNSHSDKEESSNS